MFRTRDTPRLRRQGGKSRGGMRFSHADVAAGRLVMDTEISAKELVHEKTYTLTELAKTQLKITRDELDSSLVPLLFGGESEEVREHYRQLISAAVADLREKG